MVAGEIVSRSGNKCGKPGDEVSWCEEQVSRAIAEGAFEAQADSTVGVQRQAFEANCGASNVAAQMFQAIAAILRNGHGGVKRKSIAIDREGFGYALFSRLCQRWVAQGEGTLASTRTNGDTISHGGGI